MLTDNQLATFNHIRKDSIITDPYDKATAGKLAKLGYLTLEDIKVATPFFNDNGTVHHVWHIKATIVKEPELNDDAIVIHTQTKNKEQMIDLIKGFGFKKIKYGSTLNVKEYTFKT